MPLASERVVAARLHTPVVIFAVQPVGHVYVVCVDVLQQYPPLFLQLRLAWQVPADWHIVIIAIAGGVTIVVPATSMGNINLCTFFIFNSLFVRFAIAYALVNKIKPPWNWRSGIEKSYCEMTPRFLGIAPCSMVADPRLLCRVIKHTAPMRRRFHVGFTP